MTIPHTLLASLLVFTGSCVLAVEEPTAIAVLPTTIRVQLASAAGGEPLTDTGVVTRNGTKTYVAHYRNRATGELQAIRVAENGTIEANEPRRSEPDPRPTAQDQTPPAQSVAQPPAAGPGTPDATAPARSAGPAPAAPPKKAGGEPTPAPADITPRKPDEPRTGRETKKERDGREARESGTKPGRFPAEGSNPPAGSPDGE